MKYIVTWRPTYAEETYLTIFSVRKPAAVSGDVDLTVSQIMNIALAVEECEDADDYEIHSIVRADNVEVIY